MRVLIAPDSFKESLSAPAVAQALAAGALAAAKQAGVDLHIDLCPLADGGEGTVEAMVLAGKGEFRTAEVCGPLGEQRKARFGLLAGGRVAVIEMAEAAGLTLVPPEKRNPLLTTTFGVGQLIRAALDAGSRELIVGIGGSASNDGGAGCAQALGVVFIGSQNQPCVCGLAGGGLGEIERIDASDRDPRLAGCTVRVACDVDNPLTGPRGASAVYGPQKGATPEMVQRLDAGLARLAEVIRRDLKIDVEKLPGAGAAGGLGAGLVAFAGAKLQRGIEIVADAVGLSERARAAEVVLTGEGKFDAQSAAGKTAVGVARIAAAEGRPVICIPGQATPDAPRKLFQAVHPLVDGDVTLEQALADPTGLLRRRAAEALTAFLAQSQPA